MALEPTQPPIQWVPGVFSLGIKRPGREADHSPPSSAEVKEWAIPPLPNAPSWRGAQLKQRDNFCLYIRNMWMDNTPATQGTITTQKLLDISTNAGSHLHLHVQWIRGRRNNLWTSDTAKQFLQFQHTQYREPVASFPARY
jgi:hypothetical protein